MFDLLALLFLVIAAYFTGVFRTESRLAGLGIQRAELFTGLQAAVFFCALAYRLLEAGPFAYKYVGFVMTLAVLAISAAWFVVLRRARKGARPGGPLPK